MAILKTRGWEKRIERKTEAEIDRLRKKERERERERERIKEKKPSHSIGLLLYSDFRSLIKW